MSKVITFEALDMIVDEYSELIDAILEMCEIVRDTLGANLSQLLALVREIMRELTPRPARLPLSAVNPVQYYIPKRYRATKVKARGKQ